MREGRSMMGLRLTQASRIGWSAKFATPLRIPPAGKSRGSRRGYIANDAAALKATAAGRQRLNAMLGYLAVSGTIPAQGSDGAHARSRARMAWRVLTRAGAPARCGFIIRRSSACRRLSRPS